MKNELPTFEIVIDENSGVEAIKLTDKPIKNYITILDLNSGDELFKKGIHPNQSFLESIIKENENK